MLTTPKNDGDNVVTPSARSKRLKAYTLAALCAGFALFTGGHGALGQTSAAPVKTAWESTTSTSLRASGRLLNQATFGPTADDILHVEKVGLGPYLDEQLNMTPYLMPAPIPAEDYHNGDCDNWRCFPEAWWWQDVLFGKDQLRQRVAFALSKLFVVSMNDVDARYYPYYLNVLSKDAFGNWRTLMQDVTLSGAMGTYLNMANSPAPQLGGHADENYAREVMQLFSIGLVALNQDGTPRLDSSGHTIPNYTPTIIQSFARAFSGYTFANNDCSVPAKPLYYWWPQPPGQQCPMQPIEQLHDRTRKTLLRNVVLSPGQSAAADLTAALDNIFADPSLPPFVCRRLIQNLVMSNPSPEYISRIAAVFIDDGQGIRGNLKAVVRAILMDPDARLEDTFQANDPKAGVMRDPVLFYTSILRAVQATQNLPSPYVAEYQHVFDVWLTDLGESPHQEPSVFSFFSPNYSIAAGALYAPEFQLENTYSLTWMMLHTQDTLDNNLKVWTPNEFSVALTTSSTAGQIALHQGPAALVDLLDAVLLHDTMTAEYRATIIKAITGLDPATMVKNAVFLVVTSPEYRVMI